MNILSAVKSRSIANKVSKDRLDSVDIQEIIDLAEQGYPVEVIYNSHSESIVLQCGSKMCNQVREVKCVCTTHSGSEILIRWREVRSSVIHWREYYILNPVSYTVFNIPDSHKENTDSQEDK